MRDRKALLGRLPHIPPHSIAAEEPNPVRAFERVVRSAQEIPAELADILDKRAVPSDDVVPEGTRGEFVPDEDRAAIDEDGTRRDGPADAVIHGKAIIHAVLRGRLKHARKPMAPNHQPPMADICRLWETRGS